MNFSQPFSFFQFGVASSVVAAVMTLGACSSTQAPPAAVASTPVVPKSAKAAPAAPTTPTTPTTPAATSRQTGATISLIRPARGAILATFNGRTNKGIDIDGQPGDPILAAAGGRVMYVGKDIRGYGNIIIIKHNDVFLTAYAHNRVMLVKEKDAVRQGQKIAEMGSTGTTGTKLHFELRRNGVAVNPQPYLDHTPAH